MKEGKRDRKGFILYLYLLNQRFKSLYHKQLNLEATNKGHLDSIIIVFHKLPTVY